MSEQVRIASTTESAEDLLKSAGPGAQLTEASETQPQSEEPRAEAEQQQRDGHGRSSYQKRIDSLVKSRAQAQQEAEALRARLAQYEQANGRGQVPKQSNTNGDGLQPEARQAERHEVPAETVVQGAERESREFQQAMHQMGQRLAANPEKKVALKAAVDEAVENGRDVPPPAFVAVIHQPNAEDVLQYVLDNEEVLEKLSKMPPQRQYEAIHRISLDLDLSPPERETSQPAAHAPARTPPPPLRPVGNSPSRAVFADPDTLSYQEFKKARDAGHIGMSAKQRRERGIT